MSVRRYRYDRDSLADCDCEIVEDDSGGYVEYADFQKLERQLAKAQAEIEKLKNELQEVRNLNGELSMARESLGVKNGTIRGI